MDNPLISILMTTYNEEEFVAEAIKSVLGQTYTNWQLIIVDDGSTDGTLAITKLYEAQDPRISRTYTPNLGCCEAVRVNKLCLATGDYITFLDGDDLLPPESLEARLRGFNNSKSLLAVTGHSKRLHQNNTAGVEEAACEFNVHNYINRKIPHEMTRYLYSRECFRKIPLTNDFVMGDGIYTYELINSAGNRIASVDTIIYIYRTNPNSLMLSPSNHEKRVRGAINCTKKFATILPSNFKDRALLKKWILDVNVFYIVRQSNFSRREKLRAIMKISIEMLKTGGAGVFGMMYIGVKTLALIILNMRL